MENKTALIITHKQCNDGLTAAWVIKDHFKNQGIELKEEDIYFLAHTGEQLEDLEQLGFWQKLHDHPEIETIYVTDFSLHFDPLNLISCLFPHVKIVEIDHHKTAFERDQSTINAIDALKSAGRYESYMDNRMSGAVLTWLYSIKVIVIKILITSVRKNWITCSIKPYQNGSSISKTVISGNGIIH
jgi:hypothetical protein